MYTCTIKGQKHMMQNSVLHKFQIRLFFFDFCTVIFNWDNCDFEDPVYLSKPIYECTKKKLNKYFFAANDPDFRFIYNVSNRDNWDFEDPVYQSQPIHQSTKK